MNDHVHRIQIKRKAIPKVYRANYDKAMQGNSLRAALKAFCLECMDWQKQEVKLCTSISCPLYPYRPYKNTSEEVYFKPESINSSKEVDRHGQE